MSATRLRSKTIALARGTYLILSIVNASVSPYILSPDEGNWKGKTGFLTGGLTVLTLVWAYFRLPETRGRTFEELDLLFAEKHISARNFAKAEVVREGGQMPATDFLHLTAVRAYMGAFDLNAEVSSTPLHLESISSLLFPSFASRKAHRAPQGSC